MPKKPVAKDGLAAEQMRVTYIYSLLAFATLTVFGTLQILVEGDPVLGFLEIAGGFAALLAALCLRLTHHIALVRHLVLAAILTMLVVMLSTGGTGGTGIFWLFIFPVSAFFLAGKKAGLWWTSALFAIVALFMALSYASLITIPYTPLALRQLLVSLVVVTVGIYVYQQSRENLAIETQKSNAVSREEKVKADIIVENIDEGVIVVDTEGNIIRASKAASDLLGWPDGELIGKKFVEAVPMVDAIGRKLPFRDRPMWRALFQGERIRLTATYMRKDGSTFPADITGKAIIIDGKTSGAVGTFRDVTEEKAVDRAKSEFVTLASHQLRTPISAIAWISELLLHGDAGGLKPEQMDYIQQVYHSNKRMAALVDAMLTVSSLELGSLPIRPEQVDLPKIAHEVVQHRLDTLPADKVLHIKEHYDPKLPIVSFDANITKTILQNLIANALKYTPNKGNVAISITQKDQKVVIEVSDTGLGIPKAQQSKIFTKLFRAENIKHEDTDGTGLGLFIVKTIAEYVGGTITFTSEENKGSTFTVSLPLAGMPKKEGGNNGD